MTFNEAVQAMLDGNKVKCSNATGVDYRYIMLEDDGSGDVVDNTGSLYQFSKRDFTADWEIASIPVAGTLLTRYGKSYRLIREADETYAVLNEETYVEKVKGINEENLVHDLWCYDFDIVDSTKTLDK